MTTDPVSVGQHGWDEFLHAYNNFCSSHGGAPLFNRGTAAVGVVCQVKQGIGVDKPATRSLERLRCPERPPATIKKLR